MTKTSKFSDEFKAKAVQRIAAGESATKVAKDLDTTTTTLWRWKQEGWGDAPTPPAPVPSNGHNGSNGHAYTPPHVESVDAEDLITRAMADAEIAKLREEVTLLRKELSAAETLLQMRQRMIERVTSERDALAKLAQVHLAERMS